MYVPLTFLPAVTLRPVESPHGLKKLMLRDLGEDDWLSVELVEQEGVKGER